MRKLLSFYFRDEGFRIIEAENGEEAIRKFQKEKADLVLLDIMMPLLNGWTACQAIRSVSDVPIIILTARSEDDDKIMGFDLGADDYVTKP
ncbi:MAG: response regulator, partial [Ignavibacteriales bacterium]